VGGAFFADVLSEAVHMTPEPWRHTVTPEWKPTIALDWGVSAPCITLLGVVSPGVDGFPAGSVCVIDELAVVDSSDLNQGLRWPVSMVAEEVASMCGRWGVRHPKGVADDAYGLDESLLDALRRHGLRVQRPKKERIAGWALVRELLHNAKERNGRPGLYISARCKYTWATLPFLPRSELRREDVDTRAADHAADALRYLCMDLHGRPRTGSGRHLGMF
jgi:hypothetical protein